jgi:ERF superfamily
VSSDWPVCASKDTEAPHRMGAALTYARRYALFALVGIAGEDDLDAPDTLVGPPPAEPRGTGSKNKSGNGVTHRQPLLSRDPSAELRKRMPAEIGSLATDAYLLAWAKDSLARKNTLLEEDARMIEAAYEQATQKVSFAVDTLTENSSREVATNEQVRDTGAHGLAIPKEPTRKRSKEHLLFVRGQPCVICKQSPSDAHHLKFAQPKTLGRKVSDEFTVPLCRSHHQDLHRHGNERAWWGNMNMTPLSVAKDLWEASPVHATAYKRGTGHVLLATFDSDSSPP